MKARLDKRPSIERARDVLDYDPATGILRWKITSGRAYIGNQAGCLDRRTGYRRVRLDGTFVLAHHICWAITLGQWPVQIDHVDGDKANNAWQNLRASTQQQNMGNIGLSAHNKSGVKGVFYHKASGQWMAQITINRKTKYLGIRRTKEEAADLYEAAAREHFGEFARTENFSPARIDSPAITSKRAKGKPTVEEVRSRLVYDPDTGIFRWGAAGPIAGQLTGDGYIRIGMFGRHYQAHVLAWVIVAGDWPTFVIHHIDAVRSNNRWENLAHVTQSENVLAILNDFETLHWQRPAVGSKRVRKLGTP